MFFFFFFKYLTSLIFLFYLNKNWQEGDGGELCIHSIAGIELIAPNEGKSIFFKSNEIINSLSQFYCKYQLTGFE